MPDATQENLLSRSTNTARRVRRWTPVALVVVLVAIVAFVLFAPEPSHQYRLNFTSASQIVKGGTVRIGGAIVGSVKKVDLTKNDLAQITISVDDDFAPLRQGTTATVRSQSLSGVANRFIDISPGPSLNRKLADDAIIPVDATNSEVDLDQIFATLNKKTRMGLKKTIRGFAQWYQGREPEANESAKQFPKALAAMRGFAADINAQNAQFSRLLTTGAQAMSALAAERDTLTSMIAGASGTVTALGSQTEALTAILRDLPDALKNGSDAMVKLRPALGDLQTLFKASDKPSRELPALLKQTQPVIERAVPVFANLRRIIDEPGPGNDSLDALRDLPPLAKSSHKAITHGTQALNTSTPMLSFIRPYGPDLMAWFRNYGSAAATYDGNGHYLSALPVFDAFHFNDDAQGGNFTPKPAAERGKGDGLSVGNLQRCPGAASIPPPDHSAPFVDSGDLANPDCDPSETPGVR